MLVFYHYIVFKKDLPSLVFIVKNLVLDSVDFIIITIIIKIIIIIIA